MLNYTVRRLIVAIPTLLVIVTVAFFMMRIAPGGPFDLERNLPAEVEANIRAAYNLDQPLIVQYFDYLAGVAQGDFGPSFRYKDFSVTELIANAFPISLQIGITAIALAMLIGVTFGIIAAVRQNRPADHIVMTGAMTGIVLPNIVVAPLLALIFGLALDWLPVAGWEGGRVEYMVMPVIALALPQIAYVSRLMRASMIEVLHTNYIRTARAKGLPWRRIIRRHALKSAFLPVVSYLAPATAAVVTGSVVIEQIFNIPGIGRFFVQGALNRDYTLVMGVVIFYATLLILLNLLADLLYAALDPKVRYR